MPVLELFDLSGRTAVVTGGGSGLGLQMADTLAELGADVVLAARKVERCEQAAAGLARHGVRALAVRCDVRDPAEVQSLAEATQAELGRIDILVNNAGAAWGAPAEDMPLEGWQKVLDVNLTGTFLCSQAFGRRMIGQGGGTIVNMASVAGLRGTRGVDAIGYATSKAGIVNFTRDLAGKWAQHGVRVNAIAPGWFHSDMSKQVLAERGAELLAEIPAGRFGGADDLRGAVAFLASSASAYVTGHTLVVDGGMSAW